MKKLMFAAAAVALVGGAYATDDSRVYDYKATVKYVDFKVVKDSGTKDKVWVKVVKTATIQGYLVTPTDCCCTEPDADGAAIYPSFLAVYNNATKKFNTTESFVKMLPANLLASYWSQKNLAASKTGTLEAQGYLMAGFGDAQGAQQQPTPGNAQVAYDFGDTDTQATITLFGEYNIPYGGTWFEPFLYHSGFGKANYKNASASQKNPCVDPTEVPGSLCLTSLSGSVIGGSYACMPNGTDINFHHIPGYFENFICQGWNIAGGANALNPDGDDPILYNVVTGTWSIKYNQKMTISTNQADNLLNAAKKIDKTFDVLTFDNDGAGGGTKDGEFYNKWLAAIGMQ